MTTRTTAFVLIALALTGLACSFSFSLPSPGQVERGPITTEDIRIPIPEEEPVELQIGFGAGQIDIHPGAEEALVEGTARYDFEQLAPRIERDGPRIQLTTGEVNRFDDFDFNFDFNFPVDERVNEWDLALAPHPMSLEINGGAFQGEAELGGLALTRLTVATGAADFDLSFSQPNQAAMERMSISAGASSLHVEGLGNAHVRDLSFDGGAGEFTLDFSGELAQATDVSIDAGLASLTLAIPESTSARIVVNGSLTDVSAAQGFSRSGDTYIQEGAGPLLTINVDMGAGSLDIRRP